MVIIIITQHTSVLQWYCWATLKPRNGFKKTALRFNLVLLSVNLAGFTDGYNLMLELRSL